MNWIGRQFRGAKVKTASLKSGPPEDSVRRHHQTPNFSIRLLTTREKAPATSSAPTTSSKALGGSGDLWRPAAAADTVLSGRLDAISGDRNRRLPIVFARRLQGDGGTSGVGKVEKDLARSQELPTDDDGCVLCPACGEKLPEADWAVHVEQEKQKLAGHISSVKERMLCEPSSNSEQVRRKRELELMRIRSNQHKRLSLKRGTTALIRDCLTPFSRQSNDETGSSSSPEGKKEDDFGAVKCTTCTRVTDYGIVVSTFDRPRCQSCFDVYRTQSLLLPASISSLIDVKQEDDDGSPAIKKSRDE
ncbi:unnamed protein product [Caenorhabditis auriculariae]|uniref:Uncharacterized protein n=1 Tax=Caenorhabditis auriculariae TaxID=2777116 RepID=A0A8S1HBV1_9PELO|nr:unnamed protein product [Caenorhabditis auriculariae]